MTSITPHSDSNHSQGNDVTGLFPRHWKAYSLGQLATPALFADVELTDSTTSLVVPAAHFAARLFIRVHGYPVGYVDIPVEPGETLTYNRIVSALGPDTIARATNHLRTDLSTGQPASVQHALPLLDLLRCAAGIQCTCIGSQSGPFITVAICTRDRGETLEHTLESLEQQTYADFKIIVIDNAPSSDAAARLIQSRFPQVQYIHEPRRGLNNARNRAIAEMSGEIIAFIDDDAIADPHWAQAIAAAFDSDDVMCVTGLVAPALLQTPGQELFERYGYSKSFNRLAFTLSSPPPDCPGFPYNGCIGTGCNSAFRRVVFDQVGLFDPRLDMGTPVPGGGDHDMFARVIRAGHTLVYDPRPVVFHHHIADLSTAIARLGQYQQAFFAFMTKSILSDRQYALGLAQHLAYWYARRTIRGLASSILKKKRPLALVFSEAIGAWRGPLSFFRSSRQWQATIRHTTKVAAEPLAATPKWTHKS